VRNGDTSHTLTESTRGTRASLPEAHGTVRKAPCVGPQPVRYVSRSSTSVNAARLIAGNRDCGYSDITKKLSREYAYATSSLPERATPPVLSYNLVAATLERLVGTHIFITSSLRQMAFCFAINCLQLRRGDGIPQLQSRRATSFSDRGRCDRGDTRRYTLSAPDPQSQQGTRFVDASVAGRFPGHSEPGRRVIVIKRALLLLLSQLPPTIRPPHPTVKPGPAVQGNAALVDASALVELT